MAKVDTSDIFKKENNPIKKFANSLAEKLQAKSEDKLTGALSDALAKIGLGKSSGKSIASQLGDAIVADLAAEFFGALGKEINRATKEEIQQNRGLVDANADDPGTLEPAAATESNVTRFPSTLNDYHLRLEIKQYKRPSPNVKADLAVKETIVLPLPRSLEDRHELSYESNLELGLYGAIANARAEENNGLAGAFTAGTAYAAQSQFSNQIFAIVQQMAGAIPNPHISALFKSPTLRRHRFDWLLAPNNEEESETLRKVLLRLKQAALPTFTKGSINLLEMPEMVKIKLMPWAENEDIKKNNMFVFKHCMIENVSVNYAPDSPTFFNGENPKNPAPSFVLLSISLLEIEYFTAKDFGRDGEKTAEDVAKTLVDESKKLLLGVNNAIQEANTVINGVGANTQSTPTETSPPINNTVVATTERYTSQLGDYVWKTADGKYIWKTPGQTKYKVYNTAPDILTKGYVTSGVTFKYTLDANYDDSANFSYTNNGAEATPKS